MPDIVQGGLRMDIDLSHYQRRFREAAELVTRGELDTGFAILEEVLAFARATGNSAASSACLSVMGDVHRLRGDLDAAAACDASSLAAARLANSDPAVLAVSVIAAGETAQMQGNLEEAERRYREALHLIRQTSAHPLYITVIERLAELEFRRGRFAQAQRLQTAALEFHDAVGNHVQVMGALRNLAVCERELGHFAEARVSFQRCRDLALAVGDWMTVHIACAEEGITFAAAGDHDRAITARDSEHPRARARRHRCAHGLVPFPPRSQPTLRGAGRNGDCDGASISSLLAGR
jgi:ATP/maltotriose-dependent transcriptional regulator MalT